MINDLNAEGNARYKGFVVDFMDVLAASINMTYELYIVPDNKNGAKKDNGEWDGMLGEILAGNATMGVALVITAEREVVVDFTKPFMTTRVTLLMKTPHFPTTYFQFMRPLDTTVWVTILGALIGTSMVYYLVEKFGTPIREMDKVTLRESIWFTFAGMVQGDTETAPVTMPGRILISAWWFFILILVSSYTANLAAFLTLQKINPPISGIYDLADQLEIEYGIVKSGSLESFFKNSELEMFQKMWMTMSQSFEGALVGSLKEGLAKVKNENTSFALIGDGITNSYIAGNDCGFTEVGQGIFPKGIGIAIPNGATYGEELSLKVLKLVDQGVLSSLESKWWTTSSDCGEVVEDPDTTALTLESLAGLYFVLVAGVLISILVALVEKVILKMIEKNMCKCCKDNKVEDEADFEKSNGIAVDFDHLDDDAELTRL